MIVVKPQIFLYSYNNAQKKFIILKEPTNTYIQYFTRKIFDIYFIK